ncbi:MAG: cellulase family glycosylhydrolase [Bacteroidales bacterium]|nr:cellulase family glycosylhydrolase [Bacteroidales bacterium]
MNRKLVRLFSLVLISLGIPVICNSQPFHVEGRKLMDPNGKEFIIRGVNNLHAWHYRKSLAALDKFKQYKINAVRVVWETEGNDFKLEEIVQKCLENKLIPIIELHDATGDTTEESLMNLVSYYTSDRIKKILLPYDHKILINIANEWGTFTTTPEFWKEVYLKAIPAIREAGYQAPIVIDAPGWGQAHEAILKYGEDLVNSDPLYNVLFSVHMYGSWNDPNKIETELQKLYDAGLPVMVGEFGYNFDKGVNNLNCTVDHTVIMRKCHELGYGYLAWSWSGNNKVNEWLDMADRRGWKNLTWWGRQVLNSEYGITQNAKLASLFEEETEAEKAIRLKQEEKAAKKKDRLEKQEAKLREQREKQRKIAQEKAARMKAKNEEMKARQMEKMKEKQEKKATNSTEE